MPRLAVRHEKKSKAADTLNNLNEVKHEGTELEWRQREWTHGVFHDISKGKVIELD